MVSEIHNKTMLVIDMVSEMKKMLSEVNIQTMCKNDTHLLKDVRTMTKKDMVLDKECET